MKYIFKKIAVSYFFLLLISYASAQSIDSLKFLYNNATIYRKGNVYMKGTERMRFLELRKEFEKSPIGLDLYLKSSKLRKLSSALNIASLITSITALSFISKSQQKSTVYVLIGSQFVIGITNMHLRSRSIEYLDHAIWQRNKDVLFTGH